MKVPAEWSYLDLVVPHGADTFVKEVSVSDFHANIVNMEISLKKLPVSTKSVCHHKYQSIDKDVFLADLRTIPLVLDPPEDPDQMVAIYKSILMHLLE